MRPRLELGMESLPLDAVEAELVVAGFFVEDRPLRGGAGRVDWRLCGLISEMLAGGRLDADRGSALLIASSGAFRAPRILLLGLGARAEFGVAMAQDLMREAMERCIALGVRRVGIAPLGIAADDFARHAVAVAGGVAEAIRGAGESGELQGDYEICLSVPESGIEVASEALDRAVSALEGQEFVTRPVSRRRHSPSPRREEGHGGFAQPRP